MRQRFIVKGLRRQLVRKLENALNSIKAMDVREAIQAEAQDRDPVLFSTGPTTNAGLSITRLIQRISEMKDLRG